MKQIEKLFSLAGRVAVVTGGGGFLGKAHCEILADQGAHVVVVDIDEKNAKAAADSVSESSGVECLFQKTDITEPAQVDEMTANVLEKFGRIDVLVNNAFLTVRGGSGEFSDRYFAPFEEYPADVLKQAMDVNLGGTVNVTKAAGKVMAEAGRGSIINVSSIYGVVAPDQRIYDEASAHSPGAKKFNTPVTYSLCKSALLNYTRYLSTYWASKGVRVNTLTPGGTFEKQDENFVKAYSSRCPMGRMADRDDYKGAIAFLASDASAYMTGANIVVDGGWTAW